MFHQNNTDITSKSTNIAIAVTTWYVIIQLGEVPVRAIEVEFDGSGGIK
jgi:hypothetical protein